MMNERRSGRKSKPIADRRWKIRFDSPPRDGLLRCAEKGDLLALFRAWDGADRSSVERRRSPRYAPAETRAWVGWWRLGHFLVTRGEIVNLSQGGALMRLGQQPPTSVPVWVCLGTPYPVDYVQARVLEIATAPPPQPQPQPQPAAVAPARPTPAAPGDNAPLYLTRLEFHAPCPPSFFVAAGCSHDTPVGD
jgi:hypothetical protein